MELSSFWSRGFWDIAYLEDKELVSAILNGGPVLLHQLEVGDSKWFHLPQSTRWGTAPVRGEGRAGQGRKGEEGGINIVNAHVYTLH